MNEVLFNSLEGCSIIYVMKNGWISKNLMKYKTNLAEGGLPLGWIFRQSPILHKISNPHAVCSYLLSVKKKKKTQWTRAWFLFTWQIPHKIHMIQEANYLSQNWRKFAHPRSLNNTPSHPSWKTILSANWRGVLVQSHGSVHGGESRGGWQCAGQTSWVWPRSVPQPPHSCIGSGWDWSGHGQVSHVGSQSDSSVGKVESDETVNKWWKGNLWEYMLDEIKAINISVNNNGTMNTSTIKRSLDEVAS